MIRISGDDKILYETILKAWGKDFQILMFLEEAGEAIQAVTKIGRGKLSGGTPEDVADEFADLSLMMEQLIICFGIEDEYEKRFASKRQRVSNRLEGRPDCYKNSAAIYMTCDRCGFFEECVGYFEEKAKAQVEKLKAEHPEKFAYDSDVGDYAVKAPGKPRLKLRRKNK